MLRRKSGDAMSSKELPARTEHLIRPEIIDVLNGEVGFIGTVVLAGSRKALSQGVQVFKSMSPLSFAFG